MSLDGNKQVVQRWIEHGVNSGNLSVADELFEPGVLAHTPQGDVRGVDSGPKMSVTMLRAAFPDLKLALDDLIAEDDRVATRWTAPGTHSGEFMGISPTSKAVTFSGFYVYRLTSGKIAEVWVSFDALSLLQQLGTLP